MRQKNECGVSIVNIILIILILIAGGVIVFLIKSDAGSDVIDLAQNIAIHYNSVVSPTSTQTETKANVVLSDEILSATPQEQTSSNSNIQNLDEYRYYFYNQLDDTTKSMYAIILNNIDALKDGYRKIEISSGSENLNVNFQGCWDAFSVDKPEIFYVDTKKVSLITHSTSNIISTRYQLVIQPQNGESYFLNCWSTSAQVQSAINEVEAEIYGVLNEASGYTSTYDRVRYIHDYIIERAEYDRTGDINNADIYGLFIKRKVVCEGYAKAFKVLLDRLGIPCIIVCGNGYSDDGSSEFHAWNYVRMEDGNWYAVDTTWDDPIIIGNGKLSDETKHRYFLRGSSEFFKSHTEDGDISGTGQNFRYPTLSASDYR